MRKRELVSSAKQQADKNSITNQRRIQRPKRQRTMGVWNYP